MSKFDILILAHLIGDFLLQNHWMAVNKEHHWLPLILHSGVYTIIIWIISYLSFAGLSWTGTVLIFASHLFLDKRTFVNWWSEHITGLQKNNYSWLRTIADQTFHLIILAIAIYV